MIVGDSYAAHMSEGTWPDYIRRYTDSEVQCLGTAGGSNYLVLKNFWALYRPGFDCVIVVLTSPFRISTINGYPNLCSSLDGNDNAPPGFNKAMKDYMKFYYDVELQYWITERMIRCIEESVEPFTKIIWLDAILGADQNRIFNSIKRGIKIKGQLTHLSITKELEEPFNISWEEYIDIVGVDNRKNHFSVINQERIGKFLSNIIMKDEEELTDNDTDLNSLPWVTDQSHLYPCVFPTDTPARIKQVKRYQKLILSR